MISKFGRKGIVVLSAVSGGGESQWKIQGEGQGRGKAPVWEARKLVAQGGV